MNGSSVIEDVKVTGSISGRNNVAGIVNYINEDTRIENVAFIGKFYPRGQNFDQEKYFERYDAQQGFYVQQWSPGSMGMDVQNLYWVAYRNLHPETNDRYMLFGSLKYELNKKI